MNYSYYPRRPVKSFQDLEVYQKGLALAVKVIKRVREELLRSEVESSPRGEVQGSRSKVGGKEEKEEEGTRNKGRKDERQENIGFGTESRRSEKIGIGAIGTGTDSKKSDNVGMGAFGIGSITDNLFETVLKIPKLVAGAHSLRFGGPEQAIKTLEECLLTCNMAVVYLEEYRDIVNKKIETDFFEETIKEYLRLRGKILRLQRSWVKFMKIRREEGK